MVEPRGGESVVEDSCCVSGAVNAKEGEQWGLGADDETASCGSDDRGFKQRLVGVP